MRLTPKQVNKILDTWERFSSLQNCLFCEEELVEKFFACPNCWNKYGTAVRKILDIEDSFTKSIVRRFGLK